MKQVWGILMVKDEQDIIFHTLTHAAEEGLSGIIVADNMSTDKTRREINKAVNLFTDSPCKIIVVDDDEVGYYQSDKMTKLAAIAHDYGAEWIVPLDADEVWVSNTDNIANYLNSLQGHINVVTAQLWNHFGTSLDAKGPIPFQNMEWKHKDVGALPKVAFRWHEKAVIGQGNHSIQIPGPFSTGGLEIRHFPYRSWEQFKRKALNGLKAYEATDLPISAGAHWRQYGKQIEQFGEDVVRTEVFEKYFWFFSPVDNGMIHDPAPFRRWNK